MSLFEVRLYPTSLGCLFLICCRTHTNYSFMFLRSLNVCFMILGEKEFKKPILDELGQNRTNIENWRRNLDQRVESWKNHEENPWMMSIFEDLGEF